jgi:GntR family transcriptional regulator
MATRRRQPEPSGARHEQIARYLREVVAAAAPGDRLPSDAELCARFGVSRMTARQAVQTLANERLLYRQRGRGTFVAARQIPRVLGSPLSFTASTRRRGMVPGSVVLASGRRPATEDEVAALELAPDDLVVMVDRVRLADGVPVAIEHAAIHPSCDFVLDDDLAAASLHDTFAAHGRTAAAAFARVASRRATAVEQRLLELGTDGVVLTERRTIVDQEGRPLEHTETVYAAERYSFEAVLHSGGDQG